MQDIHGKIKQDLPGKTACCFHHVPWEQLCSEVILSIYRNSISDQACMGVKWQIWTLILKMCSFHARFRGQKNIVGDGNRWPLDTTDIGCVVLDWFRSERYTKPHELAWYQMEAFGWHPSKKHLQCLIHFLHQGHCLYSLAMDLSRVSSAGEMQVD